MPWFHESQDRLPLTWWKGRPVYLSAILAIAGAASMILTALLQATRVADRFIFSFENAFRLWHLWTPLTYVLINPPSLWLLLTAAMLWWFGEDVEKYLGRKVFVKLLFALLLIGPVVISLICLLGELISRHVLFELRGWTIFGMNGLATGVFIAFVTLYPRARIWLLIVTIEAWIIAVAFVAIDLLQCLAARDWATFLLIISQVGLAFGYIRHEQGALRLPAVFSFKWMRRILPRKPLRVVPRPSSKAAARKAAATATGPVSEEQVDAILDKINREGMQSLTADERHFLEAASNRLSHPKDD